MPPVLLDPAAPYTCYDPCRISSSKMEALQYILLFFATTILLLYPYRLSRNRLPPSPPALPIIGHMHHLRPPRHLSMASLFNRYGPIIFLRLGSRPALIVSTPELVEEIYAKNGATFSNRPNFYIGDVIGHGNTSMFVAPYGAHWRNLRRITASELLSASRLNALASARAEEVLHMVKDMVGGEEVELKGWLKDMTYNVMARMVAGKRLLGDDVDMANRFKEIYAELLELMFAFNPRDFFPVLGWADLMGMDRRIKMLRVRLDGFAAELLVEQRRKRSEGATVVSLVTERTLVDVMLSMQEREPGTYTDDLIIGQILTVLTGGSDTIVETTESTMRVLLSHPEIMRKLRAEIDDNLSYGELLSESDISCLPYLQCILKEVMRLCTIMQGHPPHASSSDCTVKGYHVPRGTMVFLDVWGIHRDPELWDDPMAFKPERFEGHIGWRDGFRYFPFGVGRRACPGESLGAKTVMHVVGLLVQCFNWEEMTKEDVDFKGLIGLTTPSCKPLVARYKVRGSMIEALSNI